jgi:hypothetical protein
MKESANTALGLIASRERLAPSAPDDILPAVEIEERHQPRL